MSTFEHSFSALNQIQMLLLNNSPLPYRNSETYPSANIETIQSTRPFQIRTAKRMTKAPNSVDDETLDPFLSLAISIPFILYI